MEKFRLQYWDHRNEMLSINWAYDRTDYVAGDCRVRAVMGNTDIGEHNKKHFQRQNYSAPMTLEEARIYIAQNTDMLGIVHDCKGLTLEDECSAIDFDEPIEIRNIR